MNLKNLSLISDALDELSDFAEANAGGDESGIRDEMALSYNKCMKLISEERYKIFLKNAKAKLKARIKRANNKNK